MFADWILVTSYLYDSRLESDESKDDSEDVSERDGIDWISARIWESLKDNYSWICKPIYCANTLAWWYPACIIVGSLICFNCNYAL